VRSFWLGAFLTKIYGESFPTRKEAKDFSLGGKKPSAGGGVHAGGEKTQVYNGEGPP